MAEDRKLLIPVYLNQRIVFDLLAMLQGGISTVTSVSKTEQSADEKSRKMGGSFGLSQALSSLLKIDLSADATSTKAGAKRQGVRKKVFTRRHLYSIPLGIS